MQLQHGQHVLPFFPRSSNHIAHKLVRIGLSIDSDVIWLSSYHPK